MVNILAVKNTKTTLSKLIVTIYTVLGLFIYVSSTLLQGGGVFWVIVNEL